MVSRPTPGFDREHLTVVCQDGLRAAGQSPSGVSVNLTSSPAYIAGLDEPRLGVALMALRRVGYYAYRGNAHLSEEPDRPLIRVDGWHSHALQRRLDALTVTARRLTDDLPDNLGHAIDAYASMSDLPDIEAPRYRAAAQLRAQLRQRVTATVGAHAPYDPDRTPTDRPVALLLAKVRDRENRVSDLISRTWLTAIEAIERYQSLAWQHAPGVARDYALTDTLNTGEAWMRRDTVVTVIQWAREAGHGDAVAYGRWYGETFGRLEDGPDIVATYDTWRRRTTGADAHPAVTAGRDHPEGSRPRDLDSSPPTNEYRTYERTSIESRRRTS